MLRWARERHEGELAGPNETRRRISKVAPEEIPLRLTRSKTSPFSWDKCFFCDSSQSRGKALLPFPVLLLPSPYVLQFWKRQAPNKTRYIIRNQWSCSSMNKILELGIIRYVGWIMSHTYSASLTRELLRTMMHRQARKLLKQSFSNDRDQYLRDGTILTMSDLQVAYPWQCSWSKQSPWDRTVCNRKTLKQLIQILIPEVEFHRPPKVDESDRLSIKKTHDAAIHLVEKKSTDDPEQMKVLFEAALLLRKAINSCSTSFLSIPRCFCFHPMVKCFCKERIAYIYETSWKV